MAPDAAVRVVETHISTLFFTADRVFKRKKPIVTEFVDFRTIEARRAACEREVALNRRLAPAVYLGVADLTLDGDVLDHFVVMARQPDDRRLAALLDDPDVLDHLDRVAAVVAGFHRDAPRGEHIDRAAGPAAVAALWRTGIDQLAPFVPAVFAAADVERMDHLSAAALERLEPAMLRRIADGRACDGHGDLLADDIFCAPEGPQILDCLEFDDQLRYGDALADVAFLAMDLERLGHPGLARAFLDRYLAHSGDSWPGALENLHVAYRAHVRAKVTALRSAQGDPSAADAARALHRLALTHLERAQGLVVLVGGASGTGKSTLARGLAKALGAVRLSSDDLRSELVPDDAGDAGRLHGGRYAPEHVDAVYDEMRRRAGELIAAGELVVLDASWSDGDHRRSARATAAAAGVPVVELCCTCPPEVAATRIAARAARGEDSSEVTPEIAAALAAQRDRWPEAVTIDTDREPARVCEDALAALGYAQATGGSAWNG